MSNHETREPYSIDSNGISMDILGRPGKIEKCVSIKAHKHCNQFVYVLDGSLNRNLEECMGLIYDGFECPYRKRHENIGG